MSNSKSEDTPHEYLAHNIINGKCNTCEPPQDTSLDEQLMEVMLYVRTTHEVEHNDNQWTREFVFSFDEAKAKINRLIVSAAINEWDELAWSSEVSDVVKDELEPYYQKRIALLSKELGDSNG